jgi:hypothetical protein
VRTKWTLSLLALSSLALVPASGLNSWAQEERNTSDVRTLTGCVEKTDKAGQYKLMADDGSTWNLNSDAVNIPRHVGETVTVTGAVHHAEMHNLKEKAKSKTTDDSEHGQLTVTNLKVASYSCKKQ